MLKPDKNYLKVKENSSGIEKNCRNRQSLRNTQNKPFEAEKVQYLVQKPTIEIFISP